MILVHLLSLTDKLFVTFLYYGTHTQKKSGIYPIMWWQRRINRQTITQPICMHFLRWCTMLSGHSNCCRRTATGRIWGRLKFVEKPVGRLWTTSFTDSMPQLIQRPSQCGEFCLRWWWLILKQNKKKCIVNTV